MGIDRRRFLIASAAAVAASERVPARSRRRRERHVVLLGDSIFDNGVYVPGKPAVIEQTREALGEGCKATLLAHDGDVTDDVVEQLENLPKDASHLVISVGGNDALGHTNLLDQEIENSAELLAALAEVHRGFRQRYAAMLQAVKKRGLPTAVCTIYDSNFEAPKKQLADVALCVFNDAILRCAQAEAVPVIDLRRIFTAPADYANPIEPSEIGGRKMAAAIATVVAKHDFQAPRTAFYA